MLFRRWCLIRPAVHMPELDIMIAGPGTPLMAFEASAVCTSWNPGKCMGILSPLAAPFARMQTRRTASGDALARRGIHPVLTHRGSPFEFSSGFVVACRAPCVAPAPCASPLVFKNAVFLRCAPCATARTVENRAGFVIALTHILGGTAWSIFAKTRLAQVLRAQGIRDCPWRPLFHYSAPLAIHPDATWMPKTTSQTAQRMVHHCTVTNVSNMNESAALYKEAVSIV